jgi:hypothetical protein
LAIYGSLRVKASPNNQNNKGTQFLYDVNSVAAASRESDAVSRRSETFRMTGNSVGISASRICRGARLKPRA